MTACPSLKTQLKLTALRWPSPRQAQDFGIFMLDSRHGGFTLLRFNETVRDSRRINGLIGVRSFLKSNGLCVDEQLEMKGRKR